MKHICDEKGCRIISDEEYELIEESKREEVEKKKKNTTTISAKVSKKIAKKDKN